MNGRLIELDPRAGARVIGEPLRLKHSWIALAVIAFATHAHWVLAQNATIARTSPLSVTMDPADIAVEQPFAHISGTVKAPPNSSVMVAGSAAIVTTNGRFFANQVPLRVGMNAIPVTVRTEDGATAATQVSIRRTPGEMPFQLMVDENDGRLFASVEFRLGMDKKPSEIVIEFDMDGDGRVDFTTTDLQKAEATATLAPGTSRTIIARVTKKGGALLWSSRFTVYSEAPLETYKILRGVYERLLERLKARNIDAALNLIADPMREGMRARFVRAGSSLTALAQSLGTVKAGEVTDNFGSLTVLRKENGVERPFSIQFSRGSDGIWRIETL